MKIYGISDLNLKGIQSSKTTSNYVTSNRLERSPKADIINFKGTNNDVVVNAVIKAKKTILKLPQDLSNKTVFVRFDHNVPFDKEGNISDDSRIRKSIPTAVELLKRNAKLVVATHVKDPFEVKDGKLGKKISTDKFESRFKELLDEATGKDIKVTKAKDTIGIDAETLKHNMKNDEVVYLENLRFDHRETGKFAKLNETTGKYEQIKLPKEEMEAYAIMNYLKALIYM